MKRNVKIQKGIQRFFLGMLMLTIIVSSSLVSLAADNSSEELLKETVENTLQECADMLMTSIPEPTCGSVGGEWVVFGLARWDGEVPEEWFETYYKNLEAYVISCEGILHSKKYTEYSRVILALTAIGKDPTDVGGYNLLEPLADFEQTIFQGVNGPAFALLALDSGNFEIPQNNVGTTQATREMYVDYILSQELESGGWALSGEQVDIDITAMVLQALAKYTDRQDVAEAAERALDVLSQQQNENSGYIAFDSESSESISQVIAALAELNVSVLDERFVKNEKNMAERLLEFQTEDGSFKHLMDGDSDLMATEQAFYSLVGLSRAMNGATSLYTIAE